MFTCSLWNSGTGSATLLENLLCRLVAKDILPVYCSMTVKLILNVNQVAKTRNAITAGQMLLMFLTLLLNLDL